MCIFMTLMITITRFIKINEEQDKICISVKSSESENLNKSINLKVNITYCFYKDIHLTIFLNNVFLIIKQKISSNYCMTLASNSIMSHS